MNAAAHPSRSTDVSAPTVLRRAAAAEWTRLWTLRSTWWTLLAAAALMLFIGAAAGSDHNGGDAAPIWLAAQFAIVPGQFAFLLVVLLAVTGEYSTGAIRSSMQWVPRRGILLAARMVVPVVFATVCAVVVSAATDLVAWAFLGRAAEVVASDIAVSLGKIALVVSFGGLLTVGLGLLLRSTAGTLTAIFLLVLALPIALGNTGAAWLVAISDHLPGRAIVSLVVVDEMELAASTVATVMVAWVAAAGFAGGWSLLRRDTT
jgi:hypothetical protein